MSTPNPSLPPVPPEPADKHIARQQMWRMTRRGFVRGAVAASGGGLGWWWLQSRSTDNGIPWPLRAIHRLNERLWGGAYSQGRLAPEFPPAMAAEPKPNGVYGWPDDTDPATWTLTVSQPEAVGRVFRLAHLVGHPRVEMTTELKCIEGWSQVVTWGGVRLADFLTAQGLGQRPGGDWYPYLSLSTPDSKYYVGIDIASALHPQTLLCDRMNGEPLPGKHGAPLRLVITVKYGIKNIKWLSTIRFQDERPADYWAERGYDWYSGL
jgi:DMSO/TMAO reductase YedYZ molybdopterin-dependent catalytic subunit